MISYGTTRFLKISKYYTSKLYLSFYINLLFQIITSSHWYLRHFFLNVAEFHLKLHVFLIALTFWSHRLALVSRASQMYLDTGLQLSECWLFCVFLRLNWWLSKILFKLPSSLSVNCCNF